MNNKEIYHHGIKGMHWGVWNDDTLQKYSRKGTDHSNDKQLKANTNFNRIQSFDTLEKFAFYATYKKQDSDMYKGLFGKNLQTRAEYAAKEAEKEALKTGDYEEAKRLREIANNMRIYQLNISNDENLDMPSAETAGSIVGTLLKNSEFKSNLVYSIEDSKSKMKRPSQQQLFSKALNLLNSDMELNSYEKTLVYKALNLTLTNHDTREIAMQNTFYSAMKSNGYSAINDLNDQYYSSYHAKNPVIIFDTDKVALRSVTGLSSKEIDKLSTYYNIQRYSKDVAYEVKSFVVDSAAVSMRTVNDAINKMISL